MAGNTKWSHFKSNGSMLDLFLLLAMSFAVLFVIAFILIKPVDPKQKDIDLEEHLLIKLEWDDNANIDLDLWVLNPNGKRVSYRSKDAGGMILERDDLGDGNDWLMVDGERKVIHDNTEVVRMKRLVDGEYYVSVHYYSNKVCKTCNEMEFTITMVDGQQHKNLAMFTGIVYAYAEAPVFKIIVKDGKIVSYEKSDRFIALANSGG